MESCHRRSIRRNIGWTVSDDNEPQVATSPSVSPSAVDSAGRIYPGLFAVEDGDNGGDDISRDQTDNEGEAEEDEGTNWPPVTSVSREEQPPDDMQDVEDVEQVAPLLRHQTLILFLIGLFLLSLFVVPPLLYTLFFDVPQPQRPYSSSELLRMFRSELQKMLNQTHLNNTVPRSKYTIERALNYLAEQMQRRRSQQHNTPLNGGGINGKNEDGGGTFIGQHHSAPLVLLIASSTSSSAADSIATQYAVLLMKHWPDYLLINVTAQPVHTKSDLFNLMVGPLLLSSSNHRPKDNGDNGTVLMLLNGIERLHGTAPLFLHSLADPESSPIVEATGRRNVLIILTMTSSDTIKNDGNTRDCEGHIASSLLSSWQSDAVTDDQIQPIVARISAIPLCVS